MRYCKLMGFPLDDKSDAYARSAKQPFFQEISRGKPTGAPMTYSTLLAALKSDIKLDFPDLNPADFGTHSFRRFGATLAKTKGVPDDMIQYMGRWLSQSFQVYFMFSDADKVDVNRDLLS